MAKFGRDLKIGTRIPHMTGNSFLVNFKNGSTILLLILSACQCILFPSLINFFAVTCVIVVWVILLLFFLTKDIISRYPLSSFLVIGFGSTQYYFALLFTLLENKPLTFNLELPAEVFKHSLLSFIVIVIGHLIYRQLYRNPGVRKYSFLEKGNFFQAPKSLQLWIMGAIGISATFYSFLRAPNVGWEVTGTAVDKFIQALIPFSYAPFFIPFGKLYGKSEKLTKTTLIGMVLFTLVLFAISIGRNSRGGFMIGFSSVGFAYLLGLLLGVFDQKVFTMKNALLCVAIFFIVTGPIADLGTAMVNVREQRRDLPASELISKTLVAFTDKEAINARRIADNKSQDDWDERYLNNVLTARFSNLKFSDASLVQASKVGLANKDFQAFTLEYFLATLPQPILDKTGLEVDKQFVKSVSMGDYLYFSAGAAEETLGGFRTGHFAGTGMAAFGWWYLAILGIGIIPVFILFDKLFLKKKSKADTSKFQIRFSVCAMLTLDSIFRYLPFESVATMGVFLVRDWIQMIILYFLIFHFTRFITSVLITGSGLLDHKVTRQQPTKRLENI